MYALYAPTNKQQKKTILFLKIFKIYDWPLMKEKINQKFINMYRDNAEYLYFYAYKTTNDKYSSEDLVQNVFLDALKKRVHEDHDNPRAWLTIAMKYEIQNHRRRHHREILADLESSATSPPVDFQITELDLCLKTNLTEAEYELAQFSFFKEKNAPHIAEELHISPNAVRIRIHHLRQKIKEILLLALLFINCFWSHK